MGSFGLEVLFAAAKALGQEGAADALGRVDISCTGTGHSFNLGSMVAKEGCRHRSYIGGFLHGG